MERPCSSWDESQITLNPIYLKANPNIDRGSLHKAIMRMMDPPDVFAYIPGMGCGLVETFRRPLTINNPGRQEYLPVTLKPFDDIDVARMEYSLAILANLRRINTQSAIGIAELVGDKAMIIYKSYEHLATADCWVDDEDLAALTNRSPEAIPGMVVAAVAKLHEEGIMHGRLLLDQLVIDTESPNPVCTILNLWCARALSGADLDAKKCRLPATASQINSFKYFEKSALSDIVLPAVLLAEAGYPLREGELVRFMRDEYWLLRQESPSRGLPEEADWKDLFNEKYLTIRYLLEHGTCDQLNQYLFL